MDKIHFNNKNNDNYLKQICNFCYVFSFRRTEIDEVKLH